MRPAVKLILAALLTLPGVTHAQTPEIPQFTEETASGITSVYQGEWEFMVGGGVAAFDCSGDHKPDLYFAGGTARATLYRNDSPSGAALKFTAVTSGTELDRVLGAYPLDIDSDGILDLVLLRSGENVVMRGLGDCHFKRANEDWHFDGGDAWSTAFAATWEHGQSWPTIAIGNYIDRTQDSFPWGSCTANGLHRPDGQKFAPPLALKPSYCALSMLFTDWNRSGTPSLRISNDREYYQGGTEQLWHIDPGSDPAPYTAAEGWKPLKIWGMGIASTDLNGDGYPEYFLTSMADSKLQTLADGPAKPSFKDIAFSLNAIAQRPYTGGDIHPSTGWHAQFDDVNNDGLADLFIAKGNVSEMPDFATQDPNNLLLQGADGKFTEVGDKAGIASLKTARGAALVDLNDDGQLDLVVANRHDPAQIWRNTSVSTNHWLQVALHQDGPNRDAIGGWIEIKHGQAVERKEITAGGGHAGGQIGWWHFGLGPDATASIRVTWPDGKQGDWTRIAGDGFYDCSPNGGVIHRKD